MTKEQMHTVGAGRDNVVSAQASPAHRSPNPARTFLYPPDRYGYRRRNGIERLFCRLKNWRRIATRDDRLPRKHLVGLTLVAAASERI